MRLDIHYLRFALAYVVLGMSLGMHMAASHNHGQLVTHAHLLLAGFLLSLAYAVIHRLWLDRPERFQAVLQFVLQQVGTLGLVGGLFLLYGQFVPAEQLEPLLGAASTSLLLSALLMLWMVWRATRQA